MSGKQYTVESITAELRNDDKVKLAGIDADGMLRGSPALPHSLSKLPALTVQAKSSP